MDGHATRLFGSRSPRAERLRPGRGASRVVQCRGTEASAGFGRQRAEGLDPTPPARDQNFMSKVPVMWTRSPAEPPCACTSKDPFAAAAPVAATVTVPLP